MMGPIDNGFEIISDTQPYVAATLVDGCLELAVGDKVVQLREGELAYLLAWMSTWYELGENTTPKALENEQQHGN